MGYPASGGLVSSVGPHMARARNGLARIVCYRTSQRRRRRLRTAIAAASAASGGGGGGRPCRSDPEWAGAAAAQLAGSGLQQAADAGPGPETLRGGWGDTPALRRRRVRAQLEEEHKGRAQTGRAEAVRPVPAAPAGRPPGSFRLPARGPVPAAPAGRPTGRYSLARCRAGRRAGHAHSPWLGSAAAAGAAPPGPLSRRRPAGRTAVRVRTSRGAAALPAAPTPRAGNTPGARPGSGTRPVSCGEGMGDCVRCARLRARAERAGRLLCYREYLETQET
jgi:hypothetical protein